MTVKFDPKLIDSLIKDCNSPQDFFGESGLIKQFVESVMERALDAEMTEHLGYNKHNPKGHNTGNSRNGSTQKTVRGEFGEVPIVVPRDRDASFQPEILPKNQTRFEGFDDKIISLYARGLSTRDIQEQLKDLYTVDVSPSLISSVTDAVIDDVKSWQNRSLESIYPIVFLDALVVKIKENRQVINKSIYLALGVNLDGKKELLGMLVSQNEGAKFWLSVLTELKNRGLNDIFITCIDGLNGFPDAIEAVYPKAKVQVCVVHAIRNSLRYVSWKDRKSVVSDLKTVYQASTLEEAENALAIFSEKWDKQYPSISKMWLDRWENISVFFEYPEEIRKVIYTTNCIESVNMSLRKVIKNKRFFPSDDAAFKQLFLALRNITKKWSMPIRNWGAAMNRFMIEFSDRFPS